MSTTTTGAPATPSVSIEPLELVRAERLAIVWARDKACRQIGWQRTRPFFEREEQPEESWNAWRSTGYEPGCTLRTSGLVGVECDGPESTAQVRQIVTETGARPLWIEKNANKLARWHLYFRRPRELTADEDVSFRFEGGSVTGAVNNYYRCVGGNDYVLHAYTPDAPALTEAQYQELVRVEGEAQRAMVIALRSGEPLAEGGRRNGCFRLGCLLFRWTADEQLVCELVDMWQQATCKPSLEFSQVTGQVRGARSVVGRDADFERELDKHRTKTGKLTPIRQAEALAHLVRMLAKRWGDRDLAAELTMRYEDVAFDGKNGDDV